MAPVYVGADIVCWEPEEITTLRYSINSDCFESRGNFHALRLMLTLFASFLLLYCVAHRLLIDVDDARKFDILMVYSPHTVYYTSHTTYSRKNHWSTRD